jgi:hypothetical protein
VVFLPLKTRKTLKIKGFCVRAQDLTFCLRAAQHHWAQAHIIDAHSLANAPSHHLREAQPRSFVPSE